jgi:transposase
LEQLSSEQLIDLYYGDETGVSTAGYVPYGWVRPAEKVGVRVLPASHRQLNCFGLISRDCRFAYTTTEQKVNSAFLIAWLEVFATTIVKETVIVLDNAPIHKSKELLANKEQWEAKGLYLFFLPPYSPQLNIIEHLWRVMKGKWLEVNDYRNAHTLFDATNNCLAQIGISKTVNFSNYKLT